MPTGSLIQTFAPELLLIASAMLMLLATVWRPQGNEPGRAEGAERTAAFTRMAVVPCVLAAVVVIVSWGDGATGTADLRIASDGFRWMMDLIVLGGTILALGLLDADHARGSTYSPEVPVLMLLATSGMMVLAAARDLMYVFLGIELMSLAVYVLAGVSRRSARGAESAIKYFLLGAFATGFLLYGMALVYGATGSTRLVDIAAWVTLNARLSPMFSIGMGLLVVGFAFKIAAAPFHMWTPDVYDGAPLPITAYMSAVVKTAAFATFARVMTEAFGGAVTVWHPVLWWMAALTMAVGNIFALAQRNVVRMLAYSSIAHAGYLLVTIVVNNNSGTAALLFYAVAYTLATMGTYAVLITVNDGRDHAPTLDDLAGLWLVRPRLAIAMSIFVLSLMGMPLVGGMGFFAKWYVLQAALQATSAQTQLAIVLVVSSAVSAAYYLSILAAMFMRPRVDARIVPIATSWSRGLIAVTALLLLALGVYPLPASRLVHLATSSSRSDSTRGTVPAVPKARVNTASFIPDR